jgi:dihydroflavonol-4-reductase
MPRDRVLITGANGFLGVNLLIQLRNENFDVRALVRDRDFLMDGVELIYGDLNEKDVRLSALEACKFVVHCASITNQSSKNLEDYYDVNVLLTTKLLKECHELGVECFIYVGSANSFGSFSGVNDENTIISPEFRRSGYALSKYLAQKAVLDFEAKCMRTIVVNPTFMIGPNDSKLTSSQLVNKFLKSPIAFFPKGGKNFVDVRHVAASIVHLLHLKESNKAFLLGGENLSYKQFYSLRNKVFAKRQWIILFPNFILQLIGVLTSVLERVMHKSFQTNNVNMMILQHQTYYSSKFAEVELGHGTTDVKHALQDAFEWYKLNNN